VKDKHYASIDEVIAEIAGIPIEELAEPAEDGKHLISVDELRAAGALDVPPSWRKSLGVERDLFADLPDQSDSGGPEAGAAEAEPSDQA
jgi:hypothetical protein